MAKNFGAFESLEDFCARVKRMCREELTEETFDLVPDDPKANQKRQFLCNRLRNLTTPEAILAEEYNYC